MLKKQHFELLKLIENEKKLSKVAEFLNLTERSIRYKIDEINEELGDDFPAEGIEQLINGMIERDIKIVDKKNKEYIIKI